MTAPISPYYVGTTPGGSDWFVYRKPGMTDGDYLAACYKVLGRYNRLWTRHKARRAAARKDRP